MAVCSGLDGGARLPPGGAPASSTARSAASARATRAPRAAAAAALAELRGVKQRLITTLRLLKLSNQLAMIKANNFELKITLKA